MSNPKTGKWLALTFAGLIVLISLGFLTGSAERIINACKAFIYCNGAELPDKAGEHK